MWLRIGTSGELLCKRSWTIRFLAMLGFLYQTRKSQCLKNSVTCLAAVHGDQFCPSVWCQRPIRPDFWFSTSCVWAFGRTARQEFGPSEGSACTVRAGGRRKKGTASITTTLAAGHSWHLTPDLHVMLSPEIDTAPLSLLFVSTLCPGNRCYSHTPRNMRQTIRRPCPTNGLFVCSPARRLTRHADRYEKLPSFKAAH